MRTQVTMQVGAAGNALRTFLRDKLDKTNNVKAGGAKVWHAVLDDGKGH